MDIRKISVFKQHSLLFIAKYQETPHPLQFQQEKHAEMTNELQFNSALLSVASNPIATRVLIERLDALRAELDSISSPKLQSLETIATDLSNERLLKHTKSGVQPRVAYCLVDILHLHSPNAPYNALQLEAIFKLFVSQFKHLMDPEGKDYPLYIHILKTAAVNDIFTLVADIPKRDELIDSLFETLYSVISSDRFETVLDPLVLDILNTVIKEPNVELSMKVMKLIMNKFLTNTKVRKGEKTHTPGFDLTLKFCEQNSEKLSRMVTKLLSDLLYEAAKIDDLDSDSDLDSDDERTAVDRFHLKTDQQQQKVQLNKIHTLMIELWRYVPETLSSATGLLENELEADDILIRTVATKAVGHILSINSTLNFATTHPLTFTHWLKKPLDVNSNVRRAWISQLSRVIESRLDLKNEIQFAITTTLTDSDEKVRIATIYQMSQLKPTMFLERVASSSIMTLMKHLVRDKHHLMRQETIKFLSIIYNAAIDSFYDEEGLNNQTNLIDWIPDEILKLVYINDINIEAEVDFILFEKIIPFEQSPEKRANRLLTVISKLSKKSQTAIFAMIKRQVQLNSVITQLFSLIDESDFDLTDEILLEKLRKVVNWLATRFPIKLNASNQFLRFFMLKNKRFFRLMTLCISTTSDYQIVTTALKELLTKISEPKNLILDGEPNVDPESMQTSMKLLMLRSSSIWYNISNISLLTDISKDTNSLFNETALLILDNVSQVNPILLKSNIDSLIDATIEGSNVVFRWRDLKAINNYAKKFSDSFYNKISSNEEFLEKLKDISLNGSPVESPFAIQILNGLKTSDKTVYFHEIFKCIWPLDREDGKNFNTSLATLGEIFECDFLTVEADSKEIGKYLTNEILFKNHNLVENENEWIDDDQLDEMNNYECNSKLLAMRVFSKWLKVETDDHEALNAMGKHIIHTFLSNIIIRGGEITREKNTPKRVQARLRLEACIQILDLGTHERFNDLINETILQILINCVQDVQEKVREGTLDKLKQLLTSNSISDKFLPLTYFVAHDPKKELREDMKIWIKAAFAKQTSKKRNDLVFEKSWVRFMHMLHNHFELKEYYDEWEESCKIEESLNEDDNDDEIQEKNSKAKEARSKIFKEFISFASTFIIFVLNCIGSNENISLFYYLSQRVKQSYDASNEVPSPEDPELKTNLRLYFVSDLTQLVITEVSKLKNWNNSTFSGKLALPKDIFGTLSRDTVMDVSKREYIPVGSSEDAAMIIRGRWRLETSNNSNNRAKKSTVTAISQVMDSQDSSRKRPARTEAVMEIGSESELESETVVSSDGEYTGKTGKIVRGNGIRRSKRMRSAPPVDYSEN